MGRLQDGRNKQGLVQRLLNHDFTGSAFLFNTVPIVGILQSELDERYRYHINATCRGPLRSMCRRDFRSRHHTFGSSKNEDNAG